MSEYHPEFGPGYQDAPMPKVKPTKDLEVEDYAIIEIMTLAIYGASAKRLYKMVVAYTKRTLKLVNFLKRLD